MTTNESIRQKKVIVYGYFDFRTILHY